MRYNKISVIIALGLVIVLDSCGEEKIKINEGRFEIPEADKSLRIENEIKASLLMVVEEITDSDNIETCTHGEKIIKSGTEILKYLKVSFTDTTETSVYSSKNNRNLTIGEIAIIIASEIKPIPIARVVGIQQCIPPFNLDIESYFWKINNDPEGFVEKYNMWIKEELKVNTTKR